MDLNKLRVAILGAGQPAEYWAAALGRDAAVAVVPDPLSDEIDALIVAPGARDSFARVREALLAGVPVLYAAPFLFSPWQAALLETVGRRQGALLRIAEPFQYHGGFRFLQRLTRGQQPLWHLRYLRSTSLTPAAGGVRIDELAVEDLAMCQALLNIQPRSVMAAAAQRDEIGDVCAVFLAVDYPHGTVVQCTISLAELTSTRQLVAVTPNRTVVLDRLDSRVPLQVMASVAESPASPAKRSISVPGSDPVAEEARRFLDAIRENDLSAANSELWVRVAALWWAARQSISFGGAVEVPAPAVVLAQTEPPPFRVIEGGGRGTRTVRRPSLTLVAS